MFSVVWFSAGWNERLKCESLEFSRGHVRSQHLLERMMGWGEERDEAPEAWSELSSCCLMLKLKFRFDIKCVLPAAVRLVRVVWNGKVREGFFFAALSTFGWHKGWLKKHVLISWYPSLHLMIYWWRKDCESKALKRTRLSYYWICNRSSVYMQLFFHINVWTCELMFECLPRSAHD